MPGFLLVMSGIVVLAVVTIDAAWTTLWPDRSGGPASSRLMAWAWRYAAGALAGRHSLLSLLGPISVALVLVFWVVLLWLGWWLIFAADDVSVVQTLSNAPASGSDRLYFVGYTIFTLGNGDFSPNGAAWQLVTVIASASGLVLISLAITYLVSVLGAVVNKRTFSSRVHAIGHTPQAFVTNTWGGDFRGIEFVLSSLAADLTRLATQHLAYPIIHFYHPAGRQESSAVAVALLDEATTLLSAGVARQVRPSFAVLRSVRGSVEGYLSTLEGGTVSWSDAAPPVPDLDALRLAGIPTAGDDEYVSAVEADSERRRKLRGLVESDHWEWQG